jgi:hypothetical protein
MSIQFNKVTWYSKLGAVIVAIVAVSLALYFNAQYKKIALIRESVLTSSSSGLVSPTGDVVLRIGESATFDGLKVTFNKVVQDSRCPADVVCIQAGAVTASVTLSNAGKTGEANLISDNIPYRFANYAVYFVHAAPIKHSKVEIDPKNYSILLRVLNTLNT